MINIDNDLKTIYKNDRFPMSTVDHLKEPEAHFQSIELTISGDQFADDKSECEISEGICTDGDLKFGKCNSAQIKITLADVTDDIAGKEFYFKQTVDDTFEMPLGYFTIDTCEKQDDLRFKDITAYDRMKNTDVEVAGWYNSLTFPMTLSTFRSSFLTFIGLTQDASNLPLPNDSMIITKTIEPSSIKGRTVIEAIEEINGVFGKINRSGQFSHVILKPVYGDYPTNDYPTNDYPISATDTSYTQPNLIDETITVAMTEAIRFKEYTVPEIDKLIIRTDDDDVGYILGTGSNAYIIQGNFLVYGKTSAELEVIAKNAFGYMAKRPYRPYQSDNIGLPYLEPGDMVKFNQTDPVVGYIFNRTLKGIQSLRDSYTASGSQQRTQVTTTRDEITILQAKTLRIKKDVEGVRVEVSDLAEATASEFEITATSISQKVSKANVIQEINLSTEGLKIDVTKVDITGLVTITSLNTPGSVVIDGGNLKAGTVTADSVKSTWVYANDINASQITAGTFSGDKISGGTISGVDISSSGSAHFNEITLQGTQRTTWISGPQIETQYVYTDFLSTTYLNGSTPVTSGNYGSYIHTSSITPDTTAAGNIDFSGSVNGASTDWCNNTFELKTPSDFRLKKDITTLDLPIGLFMELKPKSFRFKCDEYGDGKFYGFIAQEMRSAFKRYGYNPDDLNILEKVNTRHYTDECLYVDDKIDRINYTNITPWLVEVVQKICEKLEMH